MDSSITNIVKDINGLLQVQQVVSYSASTGSGKTLAIPIGLHMLGWRRIMHIQPRIVAVESIVKYMEDVNETLFKYNNQIDIGSSAYERITFNIERDINYVTGGFAADYILRRYHSNKENFMDFVDLIIIDEASDTSAEYGFLLLLIYFAKSRGYTLPKILLTSASQMKGYTEIDIIEPYPYYSPQTGYNVQIIYGNYSLEIEKSILIALTNLYKTNDLSKQSTLIFLPTVDSINKVKESLPKVINGLELEVFTVSSKSSYDQYEFNVPIDSSKKSRVILATNVMEQSITVNRLSAVIDTMLESRVNTFNSKNNLLRVNTFNTTLISKSSANQRKGRVGRNYNGICYRLISKQNYERLTDIKQSDLHSIHLESDICKFIFNNLNPIELLSATIDIEKIENSIDWLIYKKLVIINKITKVISLSEAGLISVGLPVSPVFGLVFTDEENLSINFLLVIATISALKNLNNIEPINIYVSTIIRHNISTDKITSPPSSNTGKFKSSVGNRIINKMNELVITFSKRGKLVNNKFDSEVDMLSLIKEVIKIIE